MGYSFSRVCHGWYDVVVVVCRMFKFWKDRGRLTWQLKSLCVWVGMFRMRRRYWGVCRNRKRREQETYRDAFEKKGKRTRLLFTTCRLSVSRKDRKDRKTMERWESLIGSNQIQKRMWMIDEFREGEKEEDMIDDKMLLAVIDDKMLLVMIDDGCRWKDEDVYWKMYVKRLWRMEKMNMDDTMIRWRTRSSWCVMSNFDSKRGEYVRKLSFSQFGQDVTK